jgi:outer membrane usher protein FimD/PapC
LVRHRQLYVNYFIGIDDRHYSDTIAFYDVTEHTIPYHRFAIGYSQREQWGNVSANLSYRSFLNDFSKNRLSMSTNLSWRIWRGLSWNVNLSYSRIRDVINVPKDSIDPIDVLAGVTRLPTSFSYSVRTGISFTFGSIYNNVVNTRLRGGGGYSGGGRY